MHTYTLAAACIVFVLEDLRLSRVQVELSRREAAKAPRASLMENRGQTCAKRIIGPTWGSIIWGLEVIGPKGLRA